MKKCLYLGLLITTLKYFLNIFTYCNLIIAMLFLLFPICSYQGGGRPPWPLGKKSYVLEIFDYVYRCKSVLKQKSYCQYTETESLIKKINKLGLSWAKLSLSWGLKIGFLCCGLNFEAEDWSSSWSSKITIEVEVWSWSWSCKFKLKFKVNV